ncbi:MAG: acyl-CoA synthetase [Burkholderiaceae bacterium]
MNGVEWTERPERGSEWLMYLMLRVTNWVGRPSARLLLWPIAAFFWLRTPVARADSARYLARILGRPVGWRDTYRHYRTFAATILDRVFFLSGREDEFDIQIVGEEHLLKSLQGKTGVILVGAHMGSVESLRAIGPRQAGRRVTMAMFEKNAQQIGRFLRAIDPSLQDDIVALDRPGAIMVLHERLMRGDMVGLLADRSFGPETTIPVPFLGTEAPFPSGSFRMASVMRCPVVMMAGLYLGGNRYQLHFVPVADFSNVGRGPERQVAVTAAVQAFAVTLERFCRLAPYNWFNFYDFWKTHDESVLTAPGSQKPGETVSSL